MTAFVSFKLKYPWPEAATLRPEISPLILITEKLFSSNHLILFDISVTENSF